MLKDEFDKKLDEFIDEVCADKPEFNEAREANASVSSETGVTFEMKHHFDKGVIKFIRQMLG